MRRAGSLDGRVATLAIGAIGLAFLLPLAWMAASALRPQAEIFAHLYPFTLLAFLPDPVTIDNFVALFGHGYGRAVLNSLVVAGATVVLGLAACSLAAFALSAIEFRGRRVVFAIVVLSFLVPFESIAIPLSALARQWHLDDSYVALVAPGIGNGLAIFLLRQFFLGIPRELRDAAMIDGASRWAIFRHIYLPLSKPVLIGAGVLIFIFQWQAYLWPLLVTRDPDLELAPIALAKLVGQFNFDAGQMFAGAVILSIIPIFVILPLQRHFTQSIRVEGLKE